MPYNPSSCANPVNFEAIYFCCSSQNLLKFFFGKITNVNLEEFNLLLVITSSNVLGAAALLGGISIRSLGVRLVLVCGADGVESPGVATCDA